MNRKLEHLLTQIYDFGVDYDSKEKRHTEQMLNITPDTGQFLSMLIQSTKAERVLEVGTSNGYSTIWLADALRNNGRGKVITVEVSEKKVITARDNFKKSRLDSYIDSRLQDIRMFLKIQVEETADFIFLDAERPQYVSYWKDLDRVLKTGSLLVVDNALSPKPEELADFFKLVNHSGRYLTLTLQIGKGEMVALKQRRAPH